MRSGSAIRRSCSSSWPSLILLCLISSACPKTPPVEQAPTAAVCRKWNREQLVGFYVLVQLAQQKRATGDEAHVAAAVEAMGALLTRCGILQPADPD